MPASLRSHTVPASVVAAVALLLASANVAGAQASRLVVMPVSPGVTAVPADSLTVGRRYRVTLAKLPDRIGPQFPQERYLTGELVAMHGDSLSLRPHPLTSSVMVPIAAVDRLEASRGVSRAGSAFENAIGGAIVGALGGWSLYEHGMPGANFATRGRAIGTGAAYVASIGFLTGLVFPTERWKRVGVPGR